MDRRVFVDASQEASQRLHEIDRNIAAASTEELNQPQLRWHRNAAQSQFRMAGEILNSLQQDSQDRGEKPGTRAKRGSTEYLDQFMVALKNGINPRMAKVRAAEKYTLLLDVLTETGGTPEGSEGGFLAPVLFDGLVELQRDFTDLADYVTVAPVLKFKGWRAIEKAAPAEPLDAAPENTETEEQESPEFAKINFQLVNYGGFLPVVSGFFEGDTPINILTYLATWWGKKVALRNNLLIEGLIDTLTPVPVATLPALIPALKTALITTLDPLISAGANIFCNQTGFALLDRLAIISGDTLWSEDFTLKKYPPVMLSDRLLPNDTDTGTTPIVVGNLRELVTLFRRPSYELASDQGQGKTSWRNNTQEVRGIYRCDPELVDSSAAVVLDVTIPS